jgi:ribonuclease Z
MRFEIKVLGSSSAMPTKTRNLSAQVLNINEKFFLIDCGEGTQIHLKRFGVKFTRINHIFISHLHGDHFFGLIGLLATLQLLGRQKEMQIFCPDELEPIIRNQLEASNTFISYPLVFIPLEEGVKDLILDKKDLQVYSFPLRHRIPTWGFLFTEKEQKRKLKKDFVARHNIPINQFENIKEGADFTDENGVLYENRIMTKAPPKSRSFAYCSDTKYSPGIIDYFKGVDVLYHEATFAEDKIKEARDKFHSTARQAAEIAKGAEAGKLLIGHFSARYENVSVLLREAQAVFPNTIAVEDGEAYGIE